MYTTLWRILPGGVAVKVGLLAAMSLVTLFLLMEVIFPAVGPLLPGSEVEVVDTVEATVEAVEPEEPVPMG